MRPSGKVSPPATSAAARDSALLLIFFLLLFLFTLAAGGAEPQKSPLTFRTEPRTTLEAQTTTRLQPFGEKKCQRGTEGGALGPVF